MSPTPKARGLILDLLLAADDNTLSAQHAVLGCQIFGIRENTARVTLARLSSEGLIESEGRGCYSLSEKARRLADDVATWRLAEKRVRPWNGSYIGVHCGATKRRDRKSMRQQGRALNMLGFSELELGLFLRPDNIEKDLPRIETRLRILGLDPRARIFRAGDFSAASEADIRKLWDGELLSKSYRKLQKELEAWLSSEGKLTVEQAARGAFLLGGQAIRSVVYDPLLPEPLVDVAARRSFVKTVIAFDARGKSLWRAFYQHNTGSPGPFSNYDQVSRMASP